MLGFPTVGRYFLYKHPTDMRKSFNGLAGLVNNYMGVDLRGGDGFVFINKRRTLIKILVWDRTGYVIYYKKLSSGTFEMPDGQIGTQSVEMSSSELLLILEGVELQSARWRKRYGVVRRA